MGCSNCEGRNDYFSWLEMLLKVVLRLVPRVLTATMIATEMPAAIRPDLIAVAPLSTADTYRRSVAAGRIVPTKSALTFADGMAVPARRDGTRSNSATGGGFGPPLACEKKSSLVPSVPGHDRPFALANGRFPLADWRGHRRRHRQIGGECLSPSLHSQSRRRFHRLSDVHYEVPKCGSLRAVLPY